VAHFKDVENQKAFLDLMLELSATAKKNKDKYLFLHQIYSAFKRANLDYKVDGGPHDGNEPGVGSIKKHIKAVINTFALNGEKNGVSEKAIADWKDSVRKRLVLIKGVPETEETIDVSFFNDYFSE